MEKNNQSKEQQVEFNEQQFDENLQEEYKKMESEIKSPNILILGTSGSGKSTLINDIFGKEVVEVGVGEPVTKAFEKIDIPHKSVVLFDSKGFEIDKENGQNFIDESVRFVNDRFDHDPDRIHLIWLVIPGNSNRVTDYDIKLYNELKKTNSPVALVFSKCDETNEEELNSMIKRFYPDKSFETSFSSFESPFFTISEEIDLGQNPVYNFSKEPLLRWSLEKLPEICRRAFISSQSNSLDMKKEEAMKVVKQHSAGSAFSGFIPIPMADAPVLMANQSAMLVRIFKIYGLTDSLAKNIAVSSVTGTLVSSVGKALAGRLLKFIPVVGTVVGGMINATVASSITYAMGASATELIKVYYDKKFDQDIKMDKSMTDFITENFESYFKTYFNKNSNKKI